MDFKLNSLLRIEYSDWEYFRYFLGVAFYGDGDVLLFKGVFFVMGFVEMHSIHFKSNDIFLFNSFSFHSIDTNFSYTISWAIP